MKSNSNINILPISSSTISLGSPATYTLLTSGTAPKVVFGLAVPIPIWAY
jgi:hypothetical protein